MYKNTLEKQAIIVIIIVYIIILLWFVGNFLCTW